MVRLRTRGPGSRAPASCLSPRSRPGRHPDVHQCRSSRHTRTASLPSDAAPRAVKSGCVSSKAANPARTTSWSSATTMPTQCWPLAFGAHAPSPGPLHWRRLPSSLVARPWGGFGGESGVQAVPGTSSSLMMGAAWSGHPRPSREARHHRRNAPPRDSPMPSDRPTAAARSRVPSRLCSARGRAVGTGPLSRIRAAACRRRNAGRRRRPRRERAAARW